MSWTNNLPEWKNTGTEPSEDLKTNGFQGGYKPPAAVFNWFWSTVSKAITEIQTTFSGHTHSQSEVTGLTDALSGKSDTGHTHNYAGSSSAGGAATSANKLNTDAGSATNPVYFANGVPVKTTYTLGKSVPSNAVFTDTTYSAATTSSAGLMSAADKTKLDGIPAGANEYILPAATSSALGGVKSGTDITVDSSGNVSVVDDSHNHVISNVDGLQSELDGLESNFDGVINGITTAGDGAAFTATVPSITALTAGVNFIMVAHTVSTTTTPTLNVNGLGAKNLRRRLSNITTSLQSGYAASWIASGKPYHVMYDGSAWVVMDMPRPSAADMYGTLAVAKGGTGATDAATALTNLGAAAASHTHAASEITSGTLGVARGGTGKATHTSNAVLTGNGTSAVKNVATASGALYATAANGAAKFGTLPIAQGGTGATTAAAALANLGLSGSITSEVVWTNASPTSAFVEQTVETYITKDILFWVIEFAYSTVMPTYRWAEIFPSYTLTGEGGTVIRAVHTHSGDSSNVVYRIVTSYTNSIFFGGGFKNGSADNSSAIPYRVSVVRKV